MTHQAYSLQTRLAQGAARDAEHVWKEHLQGCPRCSRWAARRYTYAEPCGRGLELRKDALELRGKAREKAVLDRQPIDGQETMF